MPRKIERRGPRSTTAAAATTHGESTRRGAETAVPSKIRVELARRGGLGAIRRSVPGRKESRETARVFEAASDPARLRMLAALTRARLCPCLLQGIEPMKDSALSYHLKVLRAAGLVATSSVSNYRIYEATPLGRKVESLMRRLSPDPA